MNPNRVPLSAMTRSATAHRPIPPPSAAPWTRAMTGTGQVSIASNMSAIAIASCSLRLDVEGHRGAHPGEVGAGAERRPVAGEDDGPELRRRLARRAPRRSSAARR